jgi:hypothetical protein
MSAGRQLARLGLEQLEDVDERLVEAGQALLLEGPADVEVTLWSDDPYCSAD